jgi:Tfp pilus assembly protein PilE
MKNQKGITLIALVITIIVLLILAGVSIAMLTGNNGLLTKANSTAIESLSGEAQEAVELAISATYTNKLAGGDYTAKFDLSKTEDLAGIKAQIKAANSQATIADETVDSATAIKYTYNGNSVAVVLNSTNTKVDHVYGYDKDGNLDKTEDYKY